MKKAFAYIVAAVMVLCCLSSCREEGRVIPRKTMSKIYAEMFLADQWLRDHSAARSVADTTLFYEPIFNKYGFRKIDYITSVDKYIDDPEKFTKILKGSIAILEEEEKLAMILGTEGDGLTHGTIAQCDYTVKIPMSHGVDSLNVAAASAVACWQLGRRNAKRD